MVRSQSEGRGAAADAWSEAGGRDAVGEQLTMKLTSCSFCSTASLDMLLGRLIRDSGASISV